MDVSETKQQFAQTCLSAEGLLKRAMQEVMREEYGDADAGLKNVAGQLRRLGELLDSLRAEEGDG